MTTMAIFSKNTMMIIKSSQIRRHLVITSSYDRELRRSMIIL